MLWRRWKTISASYLVLTPGADVGARRQAQLVTPMPRDWRQHGILFKCPFSLHFFALFVAKTARGNRKLQLLIACSFLNRIRSNLLQIKALFIYFPDLCKFSSNSHQFLWILGMFIHEFHENSKLIMLNLLCLSSFMPWNCLIMFIYCLGSNLRLVWLNLVKKWTIHHCWTS